MPLNRIIIRDTLIPPPVLPAQAPMNIIITSRARDSSGHWLKSTVEKPVVEISEATVNAECRSASPTLENIPCIFIVMTVITEAMIIRNVRSSRLNEALHK